MVEMLPMNGGVGDTSYANNSSFQVFLISILTWSIVKEAITQLYSTSFPTALTIADLGCSSGPNTFMVVSKLIKEVEDIRQQLHKNSIEYQIFLNDLHGNDFNSIFKSLPSFHENLKTHMGNGLGPCFLVGAPGSFYGRLFPGKSLHFVHSSNSLHWLSQVPEGIENNKGNIFISETSPKTVLEAYHKQFQKDFSLFLKCRAEELVAGGRMVLTISARTCEDRVNKECCYSWELLNLAVNDMVSEGIVEEEKLDSFNVPIYMPSSLEVEAEVLNEGSFIIEHLQVVRVNWNIYNNELNSDIPSNEIIDSGYNYAKCIRSVAEPLLVRHFGEDIIDELFSRYREIINDHMSKENIENISFTISLTKK
ncbi:salicylate carboxymethyltransferase-like [Momordica charantia]|uniref:Salicylate carboxymethyltransferase-like n=1 Tax=Momordica charantia TaxID=3673 RepID=A0A6J1BVR9_MOMCH|nr:salicylate carboxymethyltransferase-like [Momordica charantia]